MFSLLEIKGIELSDQIMSLNNVSVENILSIRVFDRGVRRVGDVMRGINEQE